LEKRERQKKKNEGSRKGQLSKKGNEEKLKIRKEGREMRLFNDVSTPASRFVCGFLVSGLFNN